MSLRLMTSWGWNHHTQDQNWTFLMEMKMLFRCHVEIRFAAQSVFVRFPSCLINSSYSSWYLSKFVPMGKTTNVYWTQWQTWCPALVINDILEILCFIQAVYLNKDMNTYCLVLFKSNSSVCFFSLFNILYVYVLPKRALNFLYENAMSPSWTLWSYLVT